MLRAISLHDRSNIIRAMLTQLLIHSQVSRITAQDHKLRSKCTWISCDRLIDMGNSLSVGLTQKYRYAEEN